MSDQSPRLRRVLLAAAGALIAALGVISLLSGFSSDWVIRVAEVCAVFGLGVVVIGAAVLFLLVGLGGWRESDAEFDRIVRRAERLAAEQPDDAPFFGDEDDGDPYADQWDRTFGWGSSIGRDLGATAAHASGPEHGSDTTGAGRPGVGEPGDLDFEAILRAALRELPMRYHLALEHVEIVVDGGSATVAPGRETGGRRTVHAGNQAHPVAHDHFQKRITLARDSLVRDFGHDPIMLKDAVAETVRAELDRYL